MKKRIARMMILGVAALAAGIGLSGCSGPAESIHPFYQEGDVTTRPELAGQWMIDDEPVEFRDLGDKSYGAVVLGDDKRSVMLFRVRVFQIEEKFYLDAQMVSVKELRPATAKCDEDPAAPMETRNEDFRLESGDAELFNHQHILLRMWPGKNSSEFSWSFLREDWARTQEEAQKLWVAHTEDDSKHLLLVAESDDLREWVRELPDDAFDSPTTIRRADAKENSGASTAHGLTAN